MQPTTVIVGIIVLALAIPLAVVLIKFNLKRRRIIQCAATASPMQLEAIYSAIEKSGTESPTTAVLARLNQSRGPIEFQLVIPPCVEPWGGMAIESTTGKEVVLSIKASTEVQSYLHARETHLLELMNRQILSEGASVVWIAVKLPRLQRLELLDSRGRKPAEQKTRLHAAANWAVTQAVGRFNR